MSATDNVMDKLVSLAKRRGFVFQSSEIYGGLGSVWDYGPLGVELKKNIKERWWRSMVHDREDIEGLDAAILMQDRKSTRLNSSHSQISYAVFCLKKKKIVLANAREALAVKAKRDAQGQSRMREGVKQFAGRCIPHLHGPVEASRRNTRAVRTEP